MHVKSICALMVLMMAGSAIAQQYSSADWSDLRRRIRNGEQVTALVRGPVPAIVPTAATTTRAESSVPVLTAKLELPRIVPAPERRIPELTTTMPASLDARKRLVAQFACQNDVPPSMALAIIHRESLFGPASIRGDAGEIGPGQIMPGTADKYGFDRRRLADDWAYNISSSTLIMRALLDQFPLEQAISAYNGGPGYQVSAPRVQTKVSTYTSNVLAIKRYYDDVQCQ